MAQGVTSTATDDEWADKELSVRVALHSALSASVAPLIGPALQSFDLSFRDCLDAYIADVIRRARALGGVSGIPSQRPNATAPAGLPVDRGPRFPGDVDPPEYDAADVNAAVRDVVKASGFEPEPRWLTESREGLQRHDDEPIDSMNAPAYGGGLVQSGASRGASGLTMGGLGIPSTDDASALDAEVRAGAAELDGAEDDPAALFAQRVAPGVTTRPTGSGLAEVQALTRQFGQRAR